MFGLFKSNEEKKLAFFNKLRTETAIKLKKSFMNSVIISNGYNELVNDEFVGSKGKFGYDKTNPIPINGLDNLEAYFDKIRYKYASIDDINSFSFPSISFQRTDENDVSKIGSSKNEKVSAKSLSIPEESLIIQGDNKFVYLIDNNVLKRQNIKIGLRNFGKVDNFL